MSNLIYGTRTAEGSEPSPPLKLSPAAIGAGAQVILAVIAVLACCYFARNLLFPIVLGILLASALAPVVRWIERALRLPSFLGAALVVILLVLALAGAALGLSVPAKRWLEEGPKFLSSIEAKLRPMKDSVESISAAASELDKVAEVVTDTEVKTVRLAEPTFSNTVFNVTSGFVVTCAITLSQLFVLLAFGQKFIERVSELPSDPFQRQRILSVFREVERMVSGYLSTSLIINVGTGIVIGLGLWAMGMPNPLLWATVAACLNFIPYAGLLIGCSIVFLVAMVSFDSVVYAALAPAIYYVANLIESNFVTPALLGTKMSMNVVVLFFGMLLWGWMWGIGGVLIAIPLTATLRIICGYVEALRPVARFMDA